LADLEGQKIFHGLVKKLKVDIFATNQLPRNYKKLGIDYETMKALKPDIIWLGLTGFGPTATRRPMILFCRQDQSHGSNRGGQGDPQVIGIPLPDMGPVSMATASHESAFQAASDGRRLLHQYLHV